MNQENFIKENGFFCTRTRNSTSSTTQHRILTIYFIDRFMIMEMETFTYRREIDREFLSEKYQNKKLFHQSLIIENQYFPNTNIRKNVSAFEINGNVVTANFYSANSDYPNVEIVFRKVWSLFKGSQYILSMNWDNRLVVDMSACTFYPFP